MADPAPKPGPDVALAEGSEFEGLLVLPRPGRIEGRVRGEVMAHGVVWVAATGVVEADLEAETVVVEGRVEGDLRASGAIELGPAAVVHGDLSAPRLRIAEGATVQGRCRCGRPAGAEPSLPRGTARA